MNVNLFLESNVISTGNRCRDLICFLPYCFKKQKSKPTLQTSSLHSIMLNKKSLSLMFPEEQMRKDLLRLIFFAVCSDVVSQLRRSRFHPLLASIKQPTYTDLQCASHLVTGQRFLLRINSIPWINSQTLKWLSVTWGNAGHNSFWITALESKDSLSPIQLHHFVFLSEFSVLIIYFIKRSKVRTVFFKKAQQWAANISYGRYF